MLGCSPLSTPTSRCLSTQCANNEIVSQGHTVASTESGKACSWGSNRFAQLGYVIRNQGRVLVLAGPVVGSAMEESGTSQGDGWRVVWRAMIIQHTRRPARERVLYGLERHVLRPSYICPSYTISYALIFHDCTKLL
jgi:hypothetical protein